MVNTADLWKKLCENAGLFGLDPAEFQKLETFFAGLDPEYFLNCAVRTLDDFPLEEVKKRFAPEELGVFLQLCIVYSYQDAENIYRKKHWSSEMFREAASDLKLWQKVGIQDHGGLFLEERLFGWAKQCLNGRVKQFGRLQCNDIHLFQPELSLYRKDDRTLEVLPAFERNNPASPDLTYGDKTINLHVPASSGLKPEQCIDSIRRMCRFSAEFHPDYDFKAIVCYSWILDAQFRDILPAGANILKFQDLGYNFTWQGHEQNSEVIWRIWGRPGLDMDVKDLPAASSMERGVKEFLLNGGIFNEGVLVIFKDQIDNL